MGLKILHAADLHLDSPFASVDAGGRTKLRAAQRRLPGLLADLCCREQCDLVLLAGDVFDGAASRDTLDALKRALERCRVPVFISPGNHDFYSPDSPWELEEWPGNVYIFRGSLRAVDLPSLDCRIYGAGYRSMDCPGLLENIRAEGDLRWKLAVLHGDPLYVSGPCCPITSAQVRESGLSYLALGHIHRAGSFRAGQTLCAWPGCPMGRGWDETGDKGVYLVTLGNSVEITQVSLGLPRFFDMTAVSRDDCAAALETVLPAVPSEDFYRVTLTGTGKPDVDALKQRFSHLGGLEIRDETREPTDIWAHTGDDSLRGVYFRMLQEQLETADEAQAEVIRLAAELSQRLLDGREVELP